MIKKPNRLPSSLDSEMIIKDAGHELEQAILSHRLFHKRALTLGGLALLSGCTINDNASVNRMLTRISRMNDGRLDCSTRPNWRRFIALQ